MAFPDKLLSADERVVWHRHPHLKVLAIPAVWFILIISATSFMITWVSGWADVGATTHRWWYAGTGAVALVLLLVCCVRPWLKRQSEHFVLTTRHVWFCTGMWRRRQHQIPLQQVENVSCHTTLAGRILRHGSLVIESAADEPLEFSTLPSPTRVQRILTQLVAEARADLPGNDIGAADAEVGRRR